jgi:hypothetical protein
MDIVLKTSSAPADALSSSNIRAEAPASLDIGSDVGHTFDPGRLRFGLYIPDFEYLILEGLTSSASVLLIVM